MKNKDHNEKSHDHYNFKNIDVHLSFFPVLLTKNSLLSCRQTNRRVWPLYLIPISFSPSCIDHHGSWIQSTCVWSRTKSWQCNLVTCVELLLTPKLQMRKRYVARERKLVQFGETSLSVLEIFHKDAAEKLAYCHRTVVYIFKFY